MPAAPARASAARPYKTWPTGRLGREPGEDNALANGTETTLSWVLVVTLPLMTKRGHFIVNGSPRVVINQLVRSPGVYFHERTWGFGKRKKRIVYADFVSRRGAWLRIQADKEGDTWARLKKTPKVPFALFYEGMSICERNPREWTIADREALLELHEEVNPTKKDLRQRMATNSSFRNLRTEGPMILAGLVANGSTNGLVSQFPVISLQAKIYMLHSNRSKNCKMIAYLLMT